jgi:hypothetical protein
MYVCVCTYTWILDQLLWDISLPAYQGPWNGKADKKKRAELSERSGNGLLPREPGDRELCSLFMYSQVEYIPNANPQLHHQKKLNISLNSGSSSN